jgi:hypothetical protein
VQLRTVTVPDDTTLQLTLRQNNKLHKERKEEEEKKRSKRAVDEAIKKK